MGALQWGLTLSSKETCRVPIFRLSRFKGLSQRAKSAELRAGASMGPHSFEQGNRYRLWLPMLPPLAYPCAYRASMGPHSFERGNSAYPCAYDRQKAASMGPHSFERGNEASLRPNPSRKYRLQWGLTLSSEETGHKPCESIIHIVLQWGLTLSSEET